MKADMEYKFEKPKYMGITKFLFYAAFLVIVCQAVYGLIHIFYFAFGPASAISITDNGQGYYFEGLTGYYNLSYDFISVHKSIVNEKLFAVSFSVLAFLASSVPQVVLMCYGRKVLKAISGSHSPFIPEAAKLMKKMGIIMVFLGIGTMLIIQIGMNLINFGIIQFENPWEFSWLLAGVITLLLADIFSRGCALQQEVDETL